MLGKNFSLLFYLKKPKKYVCGTIPIYMRITVDGQVKEMTSSRKCDPEIWDQRAERARGKTECIKELNSHLSTLQVNSRAHFFRYLTQQARANGVFPLLRAGGIFNRETSTISDQQALDSLRAGAGL